MHFVISRYHDQGNAGMWVPPSSLTRAVPLSLAAPAAHGSSHAWGRIAAAVGLHHSHSNASFEPRLQPTLWEHRILNPPSGARDRTHILTETISGSFPADPQQALPLLPVLLGPPPPPPLPPGFSYGVFTLFQTPDAAVTRVEHPPGSHVCHRVCHGLEVPLRATLASCKAQPALASTRCQAHSSPRKMVQPGGTLITCYL